MRLLTLSPVILLCLAGCAERSLTPGTLPKGATSGIYTSADAQTVASCIATRIGSVVQPIGDRLVIASVRHPELSYSVGPNDRDSVYPTQVAIIGVDPAGQESKDINGCVIAQATAK